MIRSNDCPNYIVGTGWWCTNEDDKLVQKSRKFLGANLIREQDFHKFWYQSICKNTSPKKVIIVDSNSPAKPSINSNDARIEFVSLPFNAGHSTDHIGKWSGWMRAVIFGLMYAQMADADYYVYVEQDVLLQGEGIIEHCIKSMRSPYMFGSGEGTPQVLQQSFFIVHNRGIGDFLSRLSSIPITDCDLCPEDKFAIATSPILTQLSPLLVRLSISKRRRIIGRFSNYDLLPVGFGRSRPINFNEQFFYFQHGTEEELKSYFSLEI